jgi:hypothetical protein
MNPKQLLANLEFVDEVSGKRQTYYIYENESEFVLMTVSRAKDDSFNFSIVSKDASEYVRLKFKGRKQLTVTDVLNEIKKPAYVRSRFNALNILYTLCAKKHFRIDHRYKGKELIFSNRKKK